MSNEAGPAKTIPTRLSESYKYLHREQAHGTVELIEDLVEGKYLRKVPEHVLLNEVYFRLGYELDNEGQKLVYTGEFEEGYE